MEKKALGRGLSALIPQKELQPESTSQDTVLQIPVSRIRTNKYQPRVDFNSEKLHELMNSIKEKGVVQPVLVRRAADGYELIAGERRLRAVKSVGIEKIPAIVKDVPDVDMLEISLIENIQREGLNPMEEAHAFQRFITEFEFTQEKISKVLGKDRSTIANTIRLLGLPKKIQDHISKNAITAGHARAILMLPTENDQLRVTNLVIKKGLSVRETEALASKRSRPAARGEAPRDRSIADIEAHLQRVLGTRVRIFHGKKRGRIQIEYYSTEDLNRLLDLLAAKK
jgi:ParB family chromosome partitioning protein